MEDWKSKRIILDCVQNGLEDYFENIRMSVNSESINASIQKSPTEYLMIRISISRDQSCFVCEDISQRNECKFKQEFLLADPDCFEELHKFIIGL